MKEYIGKKVAIHCPTQKESEEINKIIEENGGRSLHSDWKEYTHRTCYAMDDMSRGYNSYCHKEWFENNGYTIIPASTLISGNNYQIF